jgi:gliding motility-associated-like protein/uncharacterized repeat protein (TIGR01451 family)
VSGLHTYSFTPATGQCATATTMDINILSPSFTIRKTQISGPNPVSSSGQVISYNIDLTNTGTTDLTGINVTEIYPGTGTGTLSAPVESISSNGILNIGEIWRYTATYTVTQSDIDAGANLINTVRVAAAQLTQPVTTTAITGVAGSAAMTIAKNATETSYSAVGNILHYTITVRNTGNVTLTNITISDPLTNMNRNIATLVPGASQNFNTTYTVDQADLNAGRVDNTASASYVFRGTTNRVIAGETVPARQMPGLSVSKTATETGFSAVNDVIHYTIVVRNTGNVPLTNITVRDAATGLNQTIATLPPDGSHSFSTTHTITQDDLNAGRFNNSATASCTYGGTSYTATDDVSVPARQNPGLSVVKTVAETRFTEAGEILHYTIVVRNTGNVTLTNVVITDPNTQITCSGSPYTLVPNSSTTCTAIHTVNNNDIASGSIRNIATASGRDPNNEVIRATSNTVTLQLNNLAPSIICPAPLRTNTSRTSCSATISSGLGATWSDPNNNIASLTWNMTGATTASSPSTGINNLAEYTFNRGITTVTYTVTDIPGLSASCSFTVEVTDNVPPVVQCLAQQNRYTDPEGPYYTASATEFNPVIATDNCSMESLTNSYNGSSSLAGVRFPIGMTTVIWTATDNSGNTASCSFIINVTDNVPPVARCKDVTVYLDLVTGLYKLTASEINNNSFDNSGIADISIDVTDFDCSLIGLNNVTLSVTDIYGNRGTCTANVTVLYSTTPVPQVDAAEQVICDEGSTNLNLTSNIPNTSWMWTANAHVAVSGASDDNTGGKTSVVQHLNNADTLLHSVVYTIVPRVYGKCDLPELTSTVLVNPTPEIRLYANDTIICNGETTRIVMRNPNTLVNGRWTYDLIVIPDEAVKGSSPGGTFTQTIPLNETLINTGSELHKVVYRFVPRIASVDGSQDCSGIEGKVTIWVRPGISYLKSVSDFNGYNISCYRRSDGFIRINPSDGSAPLTYRWRGPQGFQSTDDFIRQLSAGRYDVTLTDRNRCSVNDSVNLTEPALLGMKIEKSISADGAFNINCANGKTGSIDVSAINSVGHVIYIWSDGAAGNLRTDLAAGDYRVVITDANSCVSDSTVSLIQPEELKAEASITQPFCPDKPDGMIKLDVTGGVRGTDYNYKWENSSTTGSSLENIPAGVYDVSVSDVNGCSLTAKYEVAPINAMCLIIPEAISPNNDMLNDVWNIGNTDLYPKMEIIIYNRWGQFLWKSEEGYPHPWDGKSRGRVLPMDSYHYVIDLHNGRDPFMGTITIVK